MFTHRFCRAAGIVALLAMAGIWPAAAQLPTYGVGRAAHRRRDPGLGSHYPAQRPGPAAGQRDRGVGKAIWGAMRRLPRRDG